MYRTKLKQRIAEIEAKILNGEGNPMLRDELDQLKEIDRKKEETRKYNISTYRKHSRFFFTEQEKILFFRLTKKTIFEFINERGKDFWIVRKNEYGYNVKENKTYLEIVEILEGKKNDNK